MVHAVPSADEHSYPTTNLTKLFTLHGSAIRVNPGSLFNGSNLTYSLLVKYNKRIDGTYMSEEITQEPMSEQGDVYISTFLKNCQYYMTERGRNFDQSNTTYEICFNSHHFEY